MKKVIEIKGMSCNHCKAKVEKALGNIPDVEEAKVNLAKNNAVVNCKSEVEDKVFRDAISDVGFEVVSIKEKKGLFGG